MLTAEELETAYQRGMDSHPSATNPYHYHPALRDQWDYGQRDAFLKRVTEPAPPAVKFLRKTLVCVVALILAVSVYNAMQ